MAVLPRAHILFVICVLYVACAQGKRDKSKKSLEPTDIRHMMIESSPESKDDSKEKSEKVVKKPKGFLGGLKNLHKVYRNVGDKVKGLWHKHVKKYRKVDHKSPGTHRVSVSDNGPMILIGEDKRHKKVQGKGTKAYCIEVLDENKGQKIRGIKSRVETREGKSLSSKFKMLKSRIWKCIDRMTTDTFYLVDREYRGTKEVREALTYPNVKAWAVELHPGDDSDDRKTIQYTEQKFLDEDGKPITYLGSVKKETPNPKIWRVSKKDKKKNEESGEEDDEEEEKEALEEGEKEEKRKKKKKKQK